MSRRVTFRAHAKVNPVLRVLGRRSDGYHELETVFVALDLCDLVRVERVEGPGRTIDIVTNGPFATSDIVDDEHHLAVRGAMIAREIAGSDAALRVEVRKFIPSRAGLGGGSADAAAAAAATLEVLRRREERDGDPGGSVADAIARGLAALGSDCAFFWKAQSSGAALAHGRGDAILPLDGGRARWVALVVPECACATPDVYEAVVAGEARASQGRIDAGEAQRILSAPIAEWRGAQTNDLWPAARKVVPDVARWFELVTGHGNEQYLLAGSGSSLFGVFDTESDARESLERLVARARGEELGIRLATVTRTSDKALTRAACESGTDGVGLEEVDT